MQRWKGITTQSKTKVIYAVANNEKPVIHIGTGRPLTAGWFAKQSLVIGLSSSILGPLCDGQHSTHNVLHYTQPIHVEIPFVLQLETTWWTPLLFGVAGVILGTSHPILDSLLAEGKPPRGGYVPSWPFVLTAITWFVLQYALSAVLNDPNNIDTVQIPAAGIQAVLASTAIAHWYIFDGTKQGLFMASLTAVAGPAVESALIFLGLYAYGHVDQPLNIPLWIPWVYFCGAAAVGNLGRVVMPSTTLVDLNKS